MHRVRVGLTGLAFVFLLVLLATAVLRMAQRDNEASAGNHAAAPAANAQDTGPSEPLAQLGVAPGNAPPANPAPVNPAPTGPAATPAHR